MPDVIDFFFQIISNLWTVIVGSWILSASVLIVVLNWIISLVNGSSRES